MIEMLRRLAIRPVLLFEMLVASLLANVLALATPIFVIQILNRYVAQGVDSTLVTLAGGAIIAVLLEYGFKRIRLRFAEAVNSGPDEALAIGAYDVLTTAKASAMDKLPPGVRREILSGGDTIRQAFNPQNLGVMMDVPFALLFLAVLFLLHPVLAIIAAGFVGIIFIFILISLGGLRGPTREMSTVAGRRGALIESAIVAADAVRAFNAAEFLRRRWRVEFSALEGLRRRVGRRQSGVQTMIQSAAALMTIAMISTAALLVVGGQLDIGAMIGANIMAARALMPITGLAQMVEGWARARQAQDMFREFARLPRERADGTAVAAYSGRLEAKDVAFSYPGASGPLFERLNFQLGAGEVMVVTGANGNGKTTLARMFAGLLEPLRGNLLADGIDLTQMAPVWWRRQLVYLPQEPRFFTGSLRDNLLAFNANLDAGAMHTLLGRVGLDDFVDQHADGLDMMLVNGGANLSLGMRRRLALARGLANNGQLVVLDEPTEGLDAEGAGHVYAVMNELAAQGHTIIACSHDTQIIRGAHHVLDLNEKPEPRFTTLAQKAKPDDAPDLSATKADTA
jgi:ATP-binding cassette subfamily C protein LapB